MMNKDTTTKEKIVDAAITTFIRYGARKTAMTDIASAAGVSRQTLYDQFGSKDDLVVAAIERNTDLVLTEIEKKLQNVTNLDEQLDVYLFETVVKTFNRLQTSEDVEDLISGHSDAGRAAISISRSRHKKAVMQMLSPYQSEIENTGQNVGQLAAYLVKCAMTFKHCENRRELNAMLGSLRTAILLATAPHLVTNNTAMAS